MVSGETRTVLTNLTIVDSVAEPIDDGAIMITNERISFVGGRSELEAVPIADARVLDLDGAYVTPGLINLHTHFSLALPGTVGDGVRSLNPYDLALWMAHGARRTLQCGVTTVRCVAERDHADFALRRAIRAGYLEGPSIYTAGRALICTGGHGFEGSDTLQCDGPDEFRRGVRSQVSAGADLIKVMISGGIAGEHEAIATKQLSYEELAAVLETAHNWGRKVTAHAGPAEAIAEAVELGLDCDEHGYQLTPEVAQLMAERQVSYVPTLIVTRCQEFFAEIGVPAWMAERSLSAGPRHRESYQMALAAGVDCLLGSDMPPFWPIDGTNATVREMEHMSDGGLSPIETLRAATIGPARWLGIDEKVGSLSVGKVADLVVLKRDPRESISAYRTLRNVIHEGRMVSAPEVW